MKPIIEYIQHNGYDKAAHSDKYVIKDYGPSLTSQAFTEDADINVIMERYGVTGTMPLTPKTPMYGDFSNIPDYQSALNAVAKANADFLELPAKVRARFDNNPQKLLEFMADEGNLEEAIAIGLCKKPQTSTQVTENGKPTTEITRTPTTTEGTTGKGA